jgi:hypothetical protein
MNLANSSFYKRFWRVIAAVGRICATPFDKLHKLVAVNRKEINIMATVWIAFVITAALLAISAWVALRLTGELAPILRTVGKSLLAMAIGTALFPVLLPFLGVWVWVGGYVVLIIALSAIMTVSAVAKARQTAG